MRRSNSIANDDEIKLQKNKSNFGYFGKLNIDSQQNPQNNLLSFNI